MSLNRKGLTLVEVMIALVVLLFVSLAMMQTALVSIDSNIKNILRNEAVNMAETIVNDTRNEDFDSLAEGETDLGSQDRHVRSVTVAYDATRTVVDHGVNNKEVAVTVQWDWKGETYNYTFSTVLRRSGT